MLGVHPQHCRNPCSSRFKSHASLVRVPSLFHITLSSATAEEGESMHCTCPGFEPVRALVPPMHTQHTVHLGLMGRVAYTDRLGRVHSHAFLMRWRCFAVHLVMFTVHLRYFVDINYDILLLSCIYMHLWCVQFCFFMCQKKKK